MSEPKMILVKLARYENGILDNCDIFFDRDCTWHAEENGNLYLYKEIGDDREYLAEFPCGEWRYIRRIDEENNL